tara:strand:- start:350 stop:526 length:177 start_codon:yes stop_codon:yes gene_type:complete
MRLAAPEGHAVSTAMAPGVASLAAEAALLPSRHLASSGSLADCPTELAALGAAHTAAI